MPELRSFAKHELPRELAIQVRSYVRMQWPHLDAGRTTLWTPPAGAALDRMTFVLTEGELLVSHAEANFHDAEVEGERVRVGGLSTVFTYPAHRGHGAAERVVGAATEYLRARGLAFSLLFCGERVRSLYLRAGWEQVPTMRILVGNAAQPMPLGEKSPPGLVMTLFSTRSADVREKVASKAIYVGETTW